MKFPDMGPKNRLSLHRHPEMSREVVKESFRAFSSVWDRIGQMDIPPNGGVAQGFLLIGVSGVDDAESPVREQIGEEKIGGNG